MSLIVAKVKAGLAWSGFAKVVSQLLSWISTFIVIRYLEPNDYGLVGLAFALISFFAILSEFGLADALIQKSNVSKQNHSQIFTLTFLLNCIIFFSILVSSSSIASYYENDALSPVLIFVGGNLLLSSFIVVPESLLNKSMLFKHRALFETLGSLVNTIITLYLAVSGFGYWAILIGQACNTLTRVITFNVFGESSYSLTSNFKGFKRFFSFGFFTFISRFIWAIYNRLDVFFIGKIFGTQVLGIYTVALQIASMPLDKISGSINQVAFSAFSKDSQNAQQNENFLLSLRLLAFITCPIFIGIAAISPQLIPILIGDKWSESIVFIQLLTLIMPLKLVASFVNTFIASQGGAAYNLKITLYYLLFISIGLAIGSFSDIYGVVLSLVISYLLCFFLMTIRLSRRIDITYSNFMSSFLIPLFSSLIMWLGVFFISSYFTTINSIVLLIIDILSGALIYTILIKVCKPIYFIEMKIALKKS